jgi:stress-induced morphogen
MTLKLEEIKGLIKEAIPDAEITIQDLAGDENHYSAMIKSKIFAGKSKIDQTQNSLQSAKRKNGS